jgi:hypothetical protein
MSGIIAQNVGRHGGLIKAPSGGGGGAWTLIQTLTSDGSDADLSFTSGIDSTYDEYVFKFINIHPETDEVYLTFNGSADSGSNYNVTKTTSTFVARHDEGDTETSFAYTAADDLSESTSFQIITGVVGNGNDESASGYLHLFNPSSTTFVKQFIATANTYDRNDRSTNEFIAGYFNTTSAVDAIQFKMSADEIQAGSISMYGIS